MQGQFDKGPLFPGIVSRMGDGTHQAQFLESFSPRFATYTEAAAWIMEQKAAIAKNPEPVEPEEERVDFLAAIANINLLRGFRGGAA